jgi:acetyl-CoA carboxylase biotin carboxylase subunit
MLAKLIVHAESREAAIERALRALAELRIGGVQTSVPIAARALRSEAFRTGRYDTSLLQTLAMERDTGALDVVAIAAALARHRALLGAGAGRDARPERQVASLWQAAGRPGAS